MNKKKFGVGAVISCVVLIAVYFGIKIYVTNNVEKEVQKVTEGFADYAKVDYKNVRVDLLSRAVHVTDVVVSHKTDKIHIQDIVVYEFEEKSDMPVRLDVSLNGVKVDMAKMDKKDETMKELGYDKHLLFDFSVKYQYDGEKKELIYEKIGLRADDVGYLEFRVHLGNIDLHPERAMRLLFAYPQITLNGAKVSYSDDSFAKRVFELAAKKTGVSVEKVKDKMIHDMNKGLGETKDAFTVKASKEVERFIRNPKMISISISPREPFAFGRFMRSKSPQDMIHMLNLEIKS